VPDSEDEEVQEIVVPDPDFFDFGGLQNESDIGPGQIWTLYHDQDGLPRFYFKVKSSTVNPFKATGNWLEHCPSSDKEIEWAESTKLSIACGKFKAAGFTAFDKVNCFSHSAVWESSVVCCLCTLI
jgi:hypothetical protein